MTSSTLGKRLRRLRTLALLKQRELADMCGWHGREGQARISNYELGRRNPSHADMLTLCAALRVSPNELLAGAAPAPDGIASSKVPLLEWHEIPGFVSSGKLAYVWDRRYLLYSGASATGLFAATVFGPQMSPVFEPGDVIICRAAETAPAGAYVIAQAARWYAMRRVEMDGTAMLLVTLDGKAKPVEVDGAHRIIAVVEQQIRTWPHHAQPSQP